MNIGPYSNHLEDIEALINTPEILTLDAIECDVGKKKYFAFIDAVIGTTCVARINDSISQYSASDLLRGIKKQVKPNIVGNLATSVTVEKRDGARVVFPRLDNIYTIGIAFLTDGLKARVLAGGADPAACAGCKWGVISSSFPLVWADATLQDIQAMSPIESIFYPLSTDDYIIVSSTLDTAYLINDGNSECLVENCVKFTYRANAISVPRYRRNK